MFEKIDSVTVYTGPDSRRWSVARGSVCTYPWPGVDAGGIMLHCKSKPQIGPVFQGLAQGPEDLIAEIYGWDGETAENWRLQYCRQL